MIRSGEREARGEDVEGALDLWVSDGCQRTRRVNENLLEGSISSLLLLEGNWQLLAFGAAPGLRFMLNLPSHPPQDFERPERGCSGLGSADTLPLLSAPDTCLGMKRSVWPGPTHWGSRVWSHFSSLCEGFEVQRRGWRAVAFSTSFPQCGLVQHLRAGHGQQPGLALTLVYCLGAGSTWTTL